MRKLIAPKGIAFLIIVYYFIKSNISGVETPMKREYRLILWRGRVHRRFALLAGVVGLAMTPLARADCDGCVVAAIQGLKGEMVRQFVKLKNHLAGATGYPVYVADRRLRNGDCRRRRRSSPRPDRSLPAGV
ncbi:MAG: hypothetical protein IPK63_15440 [Candidatus Competibacteraceae bacterium]|nr:hypothetical protein [Candidatus Competibacteraceae bacterium]